MSTLSTPINRHVTCMSRLRCYLEEQLDSVHDEYAHQLSRYLYEQTALLRYCNDLVHPIVVWVVTIWSKVNMTAAGASMRDATKCRLYTGSPVYTVFAYTVPHPTAWSMFYAATHPYFAYMSHLIGV